MARQKEIKRVWTRSSKSEDQPATRKMLTLVRKELTRKMDSGFSRIDASILRMEFLLEEQNANNRIVLEGLQSLWQRQDRIDTHLNSRLNT